MRFLCCSSFLFAHLWFHMWSLVIICSSSASIGASGAQCFVTLTFPGSLRKHAHLNILKISPQKKKTENFQIKMSDIFIFLLKTSRRGGSKEYPQSMFFSKIRKIMYTPVNPSFAI